MFSSALNHVFILLTSNACLQADGLPQSVFGQYAAQWFPAMVDAVLDPEGFKEGSHLHYILLDCCVTWMGWQLLFPLPPEGDAAPRLLDYLV